MEMLGNDAGTVRSIIYKLFGVMTARAQRRLGGGCELKSREDEVLVNNWSRLAYWLLLTTYALFGGSCKPNILI